MTNKTNYRTPQPSPDIQDQLEGIAASVRDNLGIPCEIKGWWIWLDENAQPTPSQKGLLSDMSFFQAKKGKNAGRYFYKHPMAPNTYRRFRNYSKSSKPQKSKTENKPAFSVGFSKDTQRQMLVDEVMKFERMLTNDVNGENYINIKPMLDKAQQELNDFDNSQKEPEPENKPEPQEASKPSDTPSADDLKSFFSR